MNYSSSGRANPPPRRALKPGGVFRAPDTIPPMTTTPRNIDINDFHAVDIRVGIITSAHENTGAKSPAFVLTIDFGPELGTRTSSAQITHAYTPDAIIGKLILAVVNLPPRRVNGVKSEVLVLGVTTQKGDGPVVLIAPDEHDRVLPGDRIL